MTDPEQYNRAKAIFLAVCDLPPDEREPVIARECGDDAALAAEVWSLLEHYDTPLDTGDPTILRTGASAGRPTKIGPYRIIHELGRGGMGIVYLAARDDAPVQQRVALKVLKRGTDTEEVVRRFEMERQVLAALNHEGIARLYDAGESDDGLPYFVMEHVNGQSIDEYCDTNRLRIDERLQLFRKVCAAVHYAHQNLVVHRDLKPSNILVTREGQPKLLDFGIAKLINPSLFMEGMDPTAPEFRVMTPEYASPEQVRGTPISTASDIYSLGVVLYELLSGHRPYRLHSRVRAEIERVICEEEPERPSTALSRIDDPGDDGDTASLETISRARGGRLEQIRRRLSGDIDNIVLMAMRKEPLRRYASVEQMSDDIERHLGGLPVRAHRDTPMYRISKFVQRNRGAVLTTAIITVLVLSSAIVSVWGWRSAVIAERDAEVARTNAESQRREASIQRDRANRLFAGSRDFADYALTDLHSMVQRLSGSMEARRTIVERVSNYLEVIAPEKPEDLETRLHVARLMVLAARLKDDSRGASEGDRAGAEQLFNEAEIRLGQLLEEAPKNTGVMDLLAFVLTYKAERLRGDAESIEICERVIALRSAISAATPSTEHDIDLAAARAELGRAYEKLNQPLEAADQYDLSLAMIAPIARKTEERFALDTVGNLYTWRGALHKDQRDFAKAETCYREAMELRRSLLLAHPDDVRILRRVANACNTLGQFLIERDRLDDAAPLLTELVDLRTRLHEEEPGDSGARHELVDALATRGGLLEAQGQLDAAVDVYTRIDEMTAAFLRASPDDEFLHGTAVRGHYGLASLARTREDYGVAERHARQALRHIEAVGAIGDAADANVALMMPIYRSYVRLELAESLLASGQFDEAREIVVMLLDTGSVLSADLRGMVEDLRDRLPGQ